MKKAVIMRELRKVQDELEWLAMREQAHNPDWRFIATPYSKRRTRLVKTYCAESNAGAVGCPIKHLIAWTEKSASFGAQNRAN